MGGRIFWFNYILNLVVHIIYIWRESWLAAFRKRIKRQKNIILHDSKLHLFLPVVWHWPISRPWVSLKLHLKATLNVGFLVLHLLNLCLTADFGDVCVVYYKLNNVSSQLNKLCWMQVLCVAHFVVTVCS